MSSDTRLILKKGASEERWEHCERGDYKLDRFDREFQERLYSPRGREIRDVRRQNAQDARRGPNH